MPLTKTFHGFIENSTDTLLIIEACRTGILPTVNRRLIERERSCIKSGTIIVFDEDESGIKRWTDGFLWSPSRILGDFLVYRELEDKEMRRPEMNTATSYNTGDLYSLSVSRGGEMEPEDNSLELQRERALVGSLTTSNTSYNFKKDGLIKKTIRVLVNGNYLHIINYYNKNDVLANLLPTPSKSQQLSCLTISSDLIPHLNGCNTNSYGSPSTVNTRQKIRNGRVAGNVKSEYRPYPLRNECNIIRSRPYNYHRYPEPPYNAPSSLHEPSSATATSSLPYNMSYNAPKTSILDSNPTTPPTSGHTSPSQTMGNDPFYQHHHHPTPRMTPFTELPHPNPLSTAVSTNAVNQEKHQQQQYHGQFQVKPIIDSDEGGDRRREGERITNNRNNSHPISPSPTPSPPINNSSMCQGRLVEPYYRNDNPLPINNPYYPRRTSTFDYY